MKVHITKDANQQFINVFGTEPTIRINEVRTSG
jgi:hypothetical protein